MFAYYVLATMNVLLATYIIATSPVKGVGRFLAPDSIVAAILAATFGIRPLFPDRFKEWTVNGYVPTPDGIFLAAVIGTVGLGAIAVGATLHRSHPERYLAASHGDEVRDLSPLKVLSVSAVSTLAYLGLLTLFLGNASVFKDGRTVETAQSGVPEIVFMIPLAGSIAVAMCLISKRNVDISHRATLLLLAASAIPVLAVSQAGSRRLIIPALMIPMIAALMRRPRPLRAWHIGAGVGGVLVLATVPYVRAAGARAPGESLAGALIRHIGDTGPVGVIRPFFTQWDTGMLDYTAVVAERLDRFGLGLGTLVEFLTRPLPSTIQPFGTSFSDQLLTDLYGGGCWDPYCPVASAPGVLYFDGGYIGVAVGGIFIGYWLRRIANLWQHNEALTDGRVIAVCIVAAYALVFARTNSIHALWWVIYTLLIAFAVERLTRWAHVRPDLNSRDSEHQGALRPDRSRR